MSDETKPQEPEKAKRVFNNPPLGPITLGAAIIVATRSADGRNTMSVGEVANICEDADKAGEWAKKLIEAGYEIAV